MDVNEQAEVLIQKIKHFIITHFGKTADHASTEQFYVALIESLREEIMVNRTATIDTHTEKKPRYLYYLSMEYLPGRLSGNNITNVGATDLVQAVM